VIFKRYFGKIAVGGVFCGLFFSLLLCVGMLLFTPWGAFPFSVTEMMADCPAWVRVLFLLDERLNMNDLLAYVLRLSQVVLLLGTFFSTVYGARILRRHEKSGFLSFYLTRMTSRCGCFFSLWGLGVLRCLIAAAVVYGMSLLLLYFGGVLPQTVWGTFLYIELHFALIWIAAFSVGLCFGSLTRRAFSAWLFTYLIWLCIFLCGVLPVFFPVLSFLQCAALYHAVIPEVILFSGFRFLCSCYLFVLLLTAASVLGGVFAFKKREVTEEKV